MEAKTQVFLLTDVERGIIEAHRAQMEKAEHARQHELPQHAMMHEISDRKAVVQEFLDWLHECYYRICSSVEHHSFNEYTPVMMTREEIMARFFGVDLRELSAEKDRIYSEWAAGAAQAESTTPPQEPKVSYAKFIGVSPAGFPVETERHTIRIGDVEQTTETMKPVSGGGETMG